MRPTINVALLARSGPRMALVSALSYLLNLGIFAFLAEFAGWSPEIAAAAAMAALTGINFLACRHYIFEAREGSLRRQVLLYLSSTIGFRAMELAAFSLIYRATNSDALILYPSVLAVSFAAKYVIAGKFIFRKD